MTSHNSRGYNKGKYNHISIHNSKHLKYKYIIYTMQEYILKSKRYATNKTWNIPLKWRQSSNNL